MNTTTLQAKVLSLQAELELVKKVLTAKPDFSVDEKNWGRIQKTVRQERQKSFSKWYGKA